MCTLSGPCAARSRSGGEPDALLVDDDQEAVVVTDWGEVRSCEGKGGSPRESLGQFSAGCFGVRYAVAPSLMDRGRGVGPSVPGTPASAWRAMNSRRMCFGPSKETDWEFQLAGPSMTPESPVTMGVTRWLSHVRANVRARGKS